MNVDDRKVTEQAVGVLVLALRVDAEAAETAIKTTALRRQLPVVDVAQALVALASGSAGVEPEAEEVVLAVWGDLLG